MNPKKQIIILVISIALIVIILNELRFVLYGPFGVPEEPTTMNCGEDRHNFNVRIDSGNSFLNFIENLKNIQEGEDGFKIAQWVRGINYTINDVKVRNSISLFSQKFYSVEIQNCQSLILEVSENGYASLRGCCGE